TGFTMAPEAATERLRSVINKDFTDADYERALEALFDEGWLTLKLYFMIGLPTERDEDIEAINEMAMRALRIAKRKSGKFVNINITVSPFIPKPHTPFQWCGQINLDEMRRKLSFLKRSINSKKFKYKGHNEEMSFLEAIFARGDERLADLIEEAWRSGCRLDGWTEFFDFSKWLVAMEKTGIDGAAYAEREFREDETLPWDNIDVGVGRDFLYREYKKAVEGKITADCRKACSACGLKCEDPGVSCSTPDEGSGAGAPQAVSLPTDQSSAIRPKVRVRVEFSKTGALRYLSHLELIAAVTRALRRAGVPFDYSKGFHPKPEISFGPSLSVGVAGEKEYFDMEVFTPFDVELYGEILRSTLPDGLMINRMSVVPANLPSLTGFVDRYEYVVGHPSLPVPDLPATFERLEVSREGKTVDLAPCVESVERLEVGGGRFHEAFGHDLVWEYKLLLRDREDVRIRMSEITGAIFGIKMEDLSIIRTRMFGRSEAGTNDWKEPL
ncbi:MAG TPA: TIGR03936 family radical SAM-associated protein, partial [Dissulfurispiraceae bacterium]|nr:TIGR03936 family radical SAM-associated protein [Dissulfurispiraceae bacterium]